MKILYVVHQFYPYYTAGTEKFTYQIASMMQKNGNKVKVVSYHVDDDMEPASSLGRFSTGNIYIGRSRCWNIVCSQNLRDTKFTWSSRNWLNSLCMF